MLRALTRAAAFAGALSLFSIAHAQVVGYGVTSTGVLFYFDVDNPATVTTVGTLPFVPEGIDFRPGTGVLYALDVGAATTQLYTVSVSNATVAPVGGGFPSQVTGQLAGNYSLIGTTIGFDFNPRTLQGDGSVRIRVVASNGTNLRLNSNTGTVAAVDTPLDYPNTDPNAAAFPAVDAAAYTNSARSTTGTSGTTTLYVYDFSTDDLATQNPPNAGQLNTVGPMGASVNAASGISFDIVTDPGSVDDGIGGDRGYVVMKRPDAPIGNEGKYLIYDVNLSTGQITGGRLVGGGAFDFGGGFAALMTPLDVDGSVRATRHDPLTDGVLVMRYMFNLIGPSLTAGALGPTATRTGPDEIWFHLDRYRAALDVDGNGRVDALTDGLMILRYMFNLRGDALISGAIGSGATRTTAAQIEAYLLSVMP